MMDRPPDEQRRGLRTVISPHLARFVVVGLSNLVLSYTVFWLSLKAFASLPIRGSLSQVVTYTVGTAWSYFWNRRWTFRSKEPALGEASRFVALQVALATSSTVLIGIAIDWLSFHETLSWVIVMGLITVFNYVLSKRWVFRESVEAEPAEGAGAGTRTL